MKKRGCPWGRWWPRAGAAALAGALALAAGSAASRGAGSAGAGSAADAAPKQKNQSPRSAPARAPADRGESSGEDGGRGGGPIGAGPAVDAHPLEPARGGLIGLTMYDDPALTKPPRHTWFDPRYAALWLKALRQPDDATRIQGARVVAQAAKRGVDPDALAQAATALIALAEDQTQHAAVRQAAVGALLSLDAKRAGPTLLKWTRARPTARNVLEVDPALVRWHVAAAAGVWRDRLTDPDLPVPVRVSAARSLGRGGVTAAVDQLKKLALARAIAPDSTNPPTPGTAPNLRLAAARAVGRLSSGGQARAAGSLADGSLVDRLVAVAMLGSSAEPGEVAVARRIAADGAAPPARARAMALLNRWGEAVPGAAALLRNAADAPVRVQAARALGRAGGGQAIAALIHAMGDRALSVRMAARRQLARAGRASQTSAASVRSALGKLIAAGPNNWRAAEQAALLAKQLDVKSQAPALARWLDADRPEVRLAAAAAMKGLASRQTLPAVFARAKHLTQVLGETPIGHNLESEQVTQLLMALGVMRYAPADSTLRRYIPKSSVYSVNARSAAIYALGLIHAGDGDSGLTHALMGRVRDTSETKPESPIVQRFAAIAVGRIQNKSAASGLKKVMQSDTRGMNIRLAAHWALGRVTGQAPAPMAAIRGAYTGFSLEPLPPAAVPKQPWW